MLFLQFVLSGLVAGAIYSIYASGLTLIYSATGIYNFAFGACSFVGGVIYYELINWLGWNRWLSALLAVAVLAPLSAIALDSVVFRRLGRGPEVQRLAGTVGLVVALPAACVVAVDFLTDVVHLNLADLGAAYSVQGLGPQPPKVYTILDGGTISSDQLVALGGTVLAVGALWLLMTRTRLGLQTRAVVDRGELATMRGIDQAVTSRATWILGIMLAALAGVLAAPMFGLSPTTNLLFVLAASGVAVIARFRSLPIAIFGGLALGAFSSVLAGYAEKIPGISTAFSHIAGLHSATIYILLLGGLLWRGHQQRRIAGVTATAEPVPEDYLAGLPAWRRWLPWIVCAAILVAWGTTVIPWNHLQAGGLEQSLIETGLAMTFVFLSFTVVVGLLGVASLAQAAFVTCGGLTAGMFVEQHYLSGGFVVALIAAAVATSALAMAVALPAFRLGGLALALSTLAMAFIGSDIVFQIDQFKNYTNGWRLSRPVLGPIDFRSDAWFIVLLMAMVALAIGVVHAFQRSATGRAILTVRFAPAAASAVGISSRRAILAAFAVSGCLAGIGGALLAYCNGAATSSTYPPETGLLWLTIAVMWGVRRPGAALLAGLTGALTPRLLETGFWGILPEMRSPALPPLLFGLSCVVLAHQPDGILADLSKKRYQKRQRRRQPSESVETTEKLTIPATVAESIPASTPSILEVQGLVAGYAGSQVLRGVDLALPERSIVAVLGPNGSGKSTLCGAIAGTVETMAGRLTFDGVDISSMRAHTRARSGIILAPESRGIFPGMTLEDNLAVTLKAQSDIDAIYERFPQLAARQHTLAGNLSGGEQQLLAMAPLLLRPPRLLMADEIAMGLAPLIAADMINTLKELRSAGTSVLMVEEKARNVLDVADYVAFLSNGAVTGFGPIDNFTETIASESYLGIDSPTSTGVIS